MADLSMLRVFRADLEDLIDRVDAEIERLSAESESFALTNPRPEAPDPVEAASFRVLARLNSLRSAGVRGKGLSDRQWILRLLRARPDGEAECYTVLADMAQEARDKSEWAYLNTETPFRLAHFEGRLARAQARRTPDRPPPPDEMPAWMRGDQ